MSHRAADAFCPNIVHFNKESATNVVYLAGVRKNWAKMLRCSVARAVCTSQVLRSTAQIHKMGRCVGQMDIAAKLTRADGVLEDFFKRPLHVCWACHKEDRKSMLSSAMKKDEGTEGEASVDIDSNLQEG